MNFNSERNNRIKSIEETIKKYLPKEVGYQKTIMEAMNYSVLAGGKRLRPMLMEETYKLFAGQDRDIIEPFMAAIEMIHSYSLVHDDLPAMDNDEYRRGRKTTHVVYGEAMAILAGDGLLNLAFETGTKAYQGISKYEGPTELDLYKRVSKALEVLGNKAGIYGMIGGQVIDIEGNDNPATKDRLDMMYGLKTGALIESSMMIGAILAGAETDEIKTIEKIAGDIGLAFQIKDDILDVTSSQAELGKPVHSDEKNEKTTYVTIMNLDNASNEVTVISEKALNSYATLNRKNEYLQELIEQLISRKN
ncbi:MAG TPA: polyprenyl synthetase family protein [Clostridiales bacterium]|nr:polyprenyl synthetase family protein [Clostridiales bacterium]